MSRPQFLYVDVAIYVNLLDTPELHLLNSTHWAAEHQQADRLPSGGPDPEDRWLQCAGKLVLAGSQFLPWDLGVGQLLDWWATVGSTEGLEQGGLSFSSLGPQSNLLIVSPAVRLCLRFLW